jgi:hypothetical protein
MTRSVLAVVLATLMISSSMAIEMKLTHVQEKRMKELQQEKWGRIIFTMAELHSLAGGPVDELTNAIEQLIADIGDRIDELDEEYNDRTLFHQSEVTRIGSDISSAQISVSSTTNLLENIFYPERAKLQFQIASNNDAISENNAYVEKLTFERQASTEAYNARVDEKNAALSAVNECIDIISSIGGGAVSFAQTKQVDRAMNKVLDTLPKSVDEVVIKVLVQLASEKFADQGALLRVLNALGDVKNEILADLQAEHDEEARLQAQFEAEVASRQRENRGYTKDNLILSGQLRVTEDRIGQKEAFLAVRQQDLANSEAELAAENASFDEATENYHDIRAELEREAAVANDTLNIVVSAGWKDF